MMIDGSDGPNIADFLSNQPSVMWLSTKLRIAYLCLERLSRAGLELFDSRNLRTHAAKVVLL